MAACHPTDAELRFFTLGLLSTADRCRVVAHLLAGCCGCAAVLRESCLGILASGSKLRPKRAARERSAARIDLGIERAATEARELLACLQAERAAASHLLADLLQLPRARRSLLVLNSARYATWGMAEALLTASSERRYDDPAEMRHLARLALFTVVRLEPGVYGKGPLRDLLARSAGELANAYRVGGRFNSARQLLSFAFDAVEEGSGDPLLRARLHDLSASLARDLRRPAEAEQALEHAYGLYRRCGEDHYAGRVLIKKALGAEYAGRPGESLVLLERAGRLLAFEEEPRMAFSLVHNASLALTDLEQFEPAASLFSASRDLYPLYGGRLMMLRLRDMEGRVAAGLGHDTVAEAALLEAYRGFAHVGLAHDMALAGLDLALLFARQGRVEELRLLLGDVVATFRSLATVGEAATALAVLEETASHERVSAFWIERVAAFLKRLRLDPAARFEPADSPR